MTAMRLAPHPFPALFLAGLLALCGAAGQAQTMPPAKVVVAPAEETRLDASARFNGRAVAAQRVDLRARVSGFLTEIGFVEGGRVEAGQVLFRIDDAAFRANLAQAQASVAAAEASLALAQVERARQEELRNRGTAAEAVFDRALAEEAKAKADLDRLRAQADAVALDLSYTTITAPFAGSVGLSAVDVGALIGPETGALVQLVRSDPMRVEFPVPERVLLETRAAAAGSDAISVTVTLSDGSLLPQPGRIDFADVSVSQATDTVTVRAVFPNPDGLLRDGALVSVGLSASTGAAELTVPQQAVQRDVTGAFVLTVAEDGTVARKPVEVGRLAEGRAVILSGLSAGERVITEGANKARPGAVVDAALAGAN
jgi:membrane fusion protein (multidrug efflux system)